jgi:hypothetical protein
MLGFSTFELDGHFLAGDGVVSKVNLAYQDPRMMDVVVSIEVCLGQTKTRRPTKWATANLFSETIFAADTKIHDGTKNERSVRVKSWLLLSFRYARVICFQSQRGRSEVKREWCYVDDVVMSWICSLIGGVIGEWESCGMDKNMYVCSRNAPIAYVQYIHT